MTQILVLGDIILDRYLDFRTVRRSPEADCPVVVCDNETLMAGGAAAVAAMCWHLGCEDVHLGGAIGATGSEKAWSLLYRSGCVVRHIPFITGRRVPTKTRHYLDGKQVFRVDAEDVTPMDDSVIDEVLDACPAEPNVILIADYCKGFVTPYLMQRVREQYRDVPVFVDPGRGRSFWFYERCSVLLPNRTEAQILQCPGEAVDASTANLLRNNLGLDAVILKLDKDGLILSCDDGTYHIPAEPTAFLDPCGAGDQVLAAMGVFIANGEPWYEAAALANRAAAIKCSKRGAVPATLAELGLSRKPQFGLEQHASSR